MYKKLFKFFLAIRIGRIAERIARVRNLDVPSRNVATILQGTQIFGYKRTREGAILRDDQKPSGHNIAGIIASNSFVSRRDALLSQPSEKNIQTVKIIYKLTLLLVFLRAR